MKYKLLLIVVSCQLFGFGVVLAQEGFGVKAYIVVPKPSNFSGLSAGAGFGVRIQHRWVVSLNGNIAWPSAIHEGDGFSSIGTHNIPVEYGGSLAYRFNDLNPTLYVYFGFSRFPALVIDRDINFIHAGIGAALFKEKTNFGLYPEISVAVPLESHMILWPEGNFGLAYHVYLPVTLRLTIKLYINP